MRWSKFFLCLPVIIFLLFNVSTVAFAEDEVTSSSEISVNHLENYKKFYSYLISEEYITSTSYVYICYDSYFEKYRAFFSDAVFYFETTGDCCWLLDSDGNSCEEIGYIPTFADIGNWGRRYVYGSDYYLKSDSTIGWCSTSDFVTFSDVVYQYTYRDPTRVFSDLVNAGSHLTFYEFGLVVDVHNFAVGKYPISFDNVYTNFVPYLRIRNTQVAVALEGVVAVNFGDVSGDNSFFPVSRITQTVGVTLIRVLPAGILIIGGILLVRLLRLSGKAF